MPSKAIVNIVRKYLREVERAGIPVYAGVLYGSYARGDARKDSDIDLVVVSSRDKPARSWRDVGLLWELCGLVDWRIEPVLVGMRRWKEADSSPLLAVVQQEGYVIPMDHHPVNAPKRQRAPGGRKGGLCEERMRRP